MNMDYAKLGTYCKVISGYAFKSSDWQDEGIPVIKIGNISNGCDVILDEQTQYVDDVFFEKLDPKYRIEKGDILVSLTGSHINQPNSMVGRSCRNYTDRLYLLNQRAGKVIPFASVNKDYLYYLFSTKAIKYDIANRAYGGANQVNVSPTDIKSIKWTFPEIGIQKKIAAVLSKYDELIHINNKRIKLLEKMAEKLYEEWFVRFRFPGYETAKFENGIPMGWNIAKVKVLVNRLPFGTLYKSDDTEPSGNVIVIDQSKDAFVGYHNNEPSHIASVDDPIAIFGDHSCKFQLMICPFSLSENVIPYKAKKDATTIFLHYSLCRLIETTEYKRHWTELMSKKILVPLMNLQERFDGYIKTILENIESLKKQNQNLTKQRDMLLPRLMSGKLEV